MLAVKNLNVEDRIVRETLQPTHRGASSARQRERVTWFDRVSTILCIAVGAGIFWFIAGTGAHLDNMNYQIDRMQTQMDQASAENASLVAQVDNLSRPARILSIAEKMGMKYANPVQVTVANHSSSGKGH